MKGFTCIPAIAMPRNTSVKLSHCSQFVTFPRQPCKTYHVIQIAHDHVIYKAVVDILRYKAYFFVSISFVTFLVPYLTRGLILWLRMQPWFLVLSARQKITQHNVYAFAFVAFFFTHIFVKNSGDHAHRATRVFILQNETSRFYS